MIFTHAAKYIGTPNILKDTKYVGFFKGNMHDILNIPLSVDSVASVNKLMWNIKSMISSESEA